MSSAAEGNGSKLQRQRTVISARALNGNFGGTAELTLRPCIMDEGFFYGIALKAITKSRQRFDAAETFIYAILLKGE